MTKRRYKSKWHRYCTVLGVILVALGGLLMLLYGVTSFIDQSIHNPFFLASYITLDVNIQFLWSIISIIVGVLLIIITIRHDIHAKETMNWIIIAFLLAILGGTLGGLVTLGGALIYIIMYFL
ncbi:hypothetical protein CEE45_08720 [Candidatus Heimdallarchaeota archaeon B3_Heim]|nr:MAG: hypothetical protein CEE45_08720 [Candidatus Heimdallarchaeota archaeon B3_Heim]